jgi:hypothetical protein
MLPSWPSVLTVLASVCPNMQGLLCRCWLGGWLAQLGSSQGARRRRGRRAGCSKKISHTTSHLLGQTLPARCRPANHWHAAGQLRRELQLIQLARANSHGQRCLLQPPPADQHTHACALVSSLWSCCAKQQLQDVPSLLTGPVTESLQLSLGLRWPPLLDKEAAAAGKNLCANAPCWQCRVCSA